MEQVTETNNQPINEQKEEKPGIVKKYLPFAWEVLKIFIITSFQQPE